MNRSLPIIIAVVALLAACASAPEPVDPPDDEYETARSLRSQIQDFDLAQYARTEFESGEEQFLAGEAAYETEDFASAEGAFNLAIDSYTTVIRTGFRAVATARREEAAAERARAEEVRAEVAVAEQYEEALAVYEQAVAAEEAGNDQEAAELYENAVALFGEAFLAASEKRQQALEALSRVDERIQGLGEQREELEESAREELEEPATPEEEN